MEFTLFYDDALKANARPQHKHDIRREFHRQLALLWQQEPLAGLGTDLTSPTQRGGFTFLPLVSSRFRLVAKIAVTMLLPGKPGQIVRRGGDIDSRLKTLLDALTMPDADQLRGRHPAPDEDPFYCLLEDGKLISELSVKTDRLLKADAGSDEVRLFIYVSLKASAAVWGNTSPGI